MKTTVKNVTAFRLELLNDPNLPRGGPGRSIQGTAALTEFAVDAEEDGKVEQLKFAKATADYNPPERASGCDVRRSQQASIASSGPFRSPSTARTKRPGPPTAIPAAAICRIRPCSRSTSRSPAGAKLTFLLTQNHGGWNSDDNQNHNLGRFRLSLTTAPGAVADPVPAAVREILAVPRDQRTAEQQAAVFSYWRTTVPEWADANKRIEDLWATHPEGTIAAGAAPARSAARHAHSQARQFSRSRPSMSIPACRLS